MTAYRLDSGERRKAIVNVAVPLFARKGFARTTMKEIAEAAGVSEALVFKHFPTKEALYAEILCLTCQCDPALERLEKLPSSTATLVHMVHFMVRHIVLGPLENPQAIDAKHRLMVNSLLEDGEYARLLFETVLDAVGPKFAACIGAAEAAGHLIGIPISVTNRFWFGQHVCAMLAYARLPGRSTVPYNGDIEEVIVQATWFILRGIGVKDEVIAAHCDPQALSVFLPPAA